MFGWAALIFLVLTIVFVCLGLKTQHGGGAADERAGSGFLYLGAFVLFAIFVVLGIIWLAIK